MQPLLTDLRDQDSFFCFTVDSPPPSPSHITRSQKRIFWQINNPHALRTTSWDVSTIDYWSEVDTFPYNGRYFIVRAIIQEHHELVIKLFTCSARLPYPPPAPIQYHEETNSAETRLVVCLAGGPDRHGHLKPAKLNFTRMPSVHTSIYVDALSDYIKSAAHYLRVMESYAGEMGATDMDVLEAYCRFMDDNRWLLYLDGSIAPNHTIASSTGLRMIEERTRGAQAESSWKAAVYAYITTTSVYQGMVGIVYVAHEMHKMLLC